MTRQAMLRTIVGAVEKLWMFGEVPVEIATPKIFFPQEIRVWTQIRPCLRLIERMMRARMHGAQLTAVVRAYNS